MGVRRNFSKGAISKFCLSFSGSCRCNGNGRSPQTALSFLPQLFALVDPQFSIFCLCCDRKARAACVQSFAVAASNNKDHASQSLLLSLARATHILLFFAHIPFVVNHTINATGEVATSEMFSALRLSETFSFHKLPNIHFSSTFYN